MSKGCHESAQFLSADLLGDSRYKKSRACLCVDRLFVFRLHSAINPAVECVISFAIWREILRGRDSSTSP
jgi:hypothetical protein